jgi:hypothetical protein
LVESKSGEEAYNIPIVDDSDEDAEATQDCDTHQHEGGELNTVSASVQNQVRKYADKHALDNKVRNRILQASDEVAKHVVAVELSARVRNPNGYVTKVIREAEKEEWASQDSGTWQDSNEAEVIHPGGEEVWQEDGTETEGIYPGSATVWQDACAETEGIHQGGEEAWQENGTETEGIYPGGEEEWHQDGDGTWNDDGNGGEDHEQVNDDYWPENSWGEGESE